MVTGWWKQAYDSFELNSVKTGGLIPVNKQRLLRHLSRFAAKRSPSNNVQQLEEIEKPPSPPSTERCLCYAADVKTVTEQMWRHPVWSGKTKSIIYDHYVCVRLCVCVCVCTQKLSYPCGCLMQKTINNIQAKALLGFCGW